jgi:cytochrome c
MIKKLFLGAAIVGVAMPFVHPFGPVRKQRSSNALSGVPPQIERACQNCHSQRTEWPLYSYLPLVSWGIEKDVAEARQRMDLSRWNEYSGEEKRDLLARIGTEVRNHRMPLPRYLMLHPDARFSEEDIHTIYECTKVQRRALRNKSE